MADIFDKLAEKVNKGVSTVGNTSKTAVEKTRINAAIRALEGEKRSIAEQLGFKVYEFAMQSQEIKMTDVQWFCDEITNRNAGIDDLRYQLSRLEAPAMGAMVQCACGQLNGADARFCAKCGNQLKP